MTYEKFLKNRLDLIQRVKSEASSMKDLSSKTDIPLNTLYQYSYRFPEIDFPKENPHHRNYSLDLKKIKKQINKGVSSMKDLSSKTDIPLNTVYKYSYTNPEIDFPKEKSSKKQKISKIKEFVSQGISDPELIAKEVNLKPSSVIRYCQEVGIELKTKKSFYDFVYTKRISSTDTLIEQGKSCMEIAKQVGVSRERVRQYILSTGQYKKWKNKRKMNKK